MKSYLVFFLLVTVSSAFAMEEDLEPLQTLTNIFILIQRIQTNQDEVVQECIDTEKKVCALIRKIYTIEDESRPWHIDFQNLNEKKREFHQEKKRLETYILALEYCDRKEGEPIDPKLLKLIDKKEIIIDVAQTKKEYHEFLELQRSKNLWSN